MKRTVILLFIFILAVAATAFFAFSLTDSASQQPANFLAADKGYGVTIDLTQYDDAALANTLSQLQQNRLLWIRQPVYWAEIEPSPGQFNWTETDRIFEAVAAANTPANEPSKRFKIIAVLHTTPHWARKPGQSRTGPPAQLSDFGHFARAFATRYGDTIHYYQIWDEPNLSAKWGNSFVEPETYANLLREGAINIRTTNPHAVILLAALAPTLEGSPLNLNELDFLDQLYQAQANRWFDVVAGQPYGIESEPADPPDAGTLNFSRIELLRQVMLKHNDADIPIWATAFGWNALPPDWNGPKSPWKSDTVSTQARRTTEATDYARQNWPWLGPMLAVRWDTTSLAPDDPARGFALLNTPPILANLSAAAANPSATPGQYPANHPTGIYSSGWRFAQTQADIPADTPRTLTIPFEGTRLDLNLTRGPYRGYLWITVDGQPANALPQNGQGRSYVVLYDPLRQPVSIPLARHLPAGHHEAVIEADGGWEQWTINGWSVYHEPDTHFPTIGLPLSAILAVFSGAGLVWLYRPRISTWSQSLTARYLRLNEFTQIGLTFGLGIVVYLMPGRLAPILLLPLAAAIILRPDLGLALTTFGLSFLSIPAPLPLIGFFPVELILSLIILGVIFRYYNPNPIISEQFVIRSFGRLRTSYSSFVIRHFKSTDLAALALTLLSLLSTLFAQNFGVSMFEWRTVVLPSVIFYFLVHFGFNYQLPITNKSFTIHHSIWIWRLIDAFVAGAALQATLVLFGYFLGHGFVTAEGVYRAVGVVYQSPNHLSLFLGRVWPILLAVSLLPGYSKLRRGLYGAGLAVISFALYLTFSKGALLLGLPAALLAMTMIYLLCHRGRYRRWVIAAAAGGITLIMLITIPFIRTARIASTFDLEQGTGFFRLKLWQASLTMLRDYWPLGVGLDNFLYQYRTRYILPEAWQEPNLSHPHNVVLDFGTRLGVGGIAILLWLQISFWRNAWRVYKKSPSPLVLGLMGSMIVFLGHGMVDNAYFLLDLALAFFLVVGIVQRLSEK